MNPQNNPEPSKAEALEGPVASEDRLATGELLDDSVSTEELERQVEGRLHGFEESFRRRHPVSWWVTLLVPLLLIVGAVFVISINGGWLLATKVVGAATATFFLLGRFVILLGQQGDLSSDWDFLSPLQLFFMVSYMDLAVALLVAFHVGSLFNLPWLGKRAASLVEDARFVLDRLPWMKNAAFTGLTLFVAFPLAATGAVGGSILGTLLGLDRLRVFLATVIGCLLGNGGLYLMADTLGRYIDTRSPVVKFGGLAVILAVVLCMEYRYRKGKKKFHDEHSRH